MKDKKIKKTRVFKPLFIFKLFRDVLLCPKCHIELREEYCYEDYLLKCDECGEIWDGYFDTEE